MFSVGKENTRCAVMELVFYLRATQGEREGSREELKILIK